jgi:hypothetical protein
MSNHVGPGDAFETVSLLRLIHLLAAAADGR